MLDLKAERKQAEEALRQTEKELRDLVENMPAMAGVLLPDGSHPYLTNQWQEYTGLSVTETDSEGWRRVVHPEDTDLYAQKFRAAAAARKPFDNELRLRRAADGKYRWFLVRISPLCDGRGNIVKWHGVMTDIQDRKRAEEATRRSEKELRDVLEQVPGMWCLQSSRMDAMDATRTLAPNGTTTRVCQKRKPSTEAGRMRFIPKTSNST